MLSLAVAMALSMHGQTMQVESMVSPSRCLSAANRFIYSVPNIRNAFESDALAAREGRPTRYTDERRTELLGALEKDEAAANAVVARYGKTKIKSADERLIRSLNLLETLTLIRACAVGAQ